MNNTTSPRHSDDTDRAYTSPTLAEIYRDRESYQAHRYRAGLHRRGMTAWA